MLFGLLLRWITVVCWCYCCLKLESLFHLVLREVHRYTLRLLLSRLVLDVHIVLVRQFFVKPPISECISSIYRDLNWLDLVSTLYLCYISSIFYTWLNSDNIVAERAIMDGGQSSRCVEWILTLVLLRSHGPVLLFDCWVPLRHLTDPEWAQ